jgi:hypothetical protein
MPNEHRSEEHHGKGGARAPEGRDGLPTAADTLNVALVQMKIVEDLRRASRDLTDVKKRSPPIERWRSCLGR